MNLPLTVLIATKNEVLNLPEALASVSWADQVIVIDSGSTDGTVEIAENAGATVRQFEYDGGWPKKRNWGLREGGVRNPWVLVLDADERISPELRSQIEAVIGGDGESDASVCGYYLRWKFVFLGRWMKHSWSHGWMLRLFKHGAVEYEDLGMRGEGGWDAEVHENLVPLDGKAKCDRLSEPLTHDSEQSLSFWIAKQNQFSDWNAKRRLAQLEEPMLPLVWLFSSDPGRRRRWMKALFLRLPWKPTILFLYLFVVKQGFLDGKAGFYFCKLRASHELNINAKIFEENVSKSLR